MSRFLTGLFAALALLISGVPAAAQSIGYSPNTLPLSGSCGVVTVSTPCLDLTQTWNNVATTFTGLKLNVTDTASAAGSLMDLQVGGVSQFKVDKAGIVDVAGRFVAPFYYVNSDTGAIFFGASLDTAIQRDGAANTLALRNGTAAQAFNVYNTYTDASNYERGVFDWASSANTLRIGTEAAGTGSARSLEFVTGGTGRWFIQAGGNLLASTNNTYDIGTSTTVGAPRYINAGSGFFVAGAGGYFWSGVGSLTMPVSGGLQINDASATNTVRMTAGASNLLTLNGGLKTTGATFALQTATTLTDNAAAQVATMTNGPAAGNPTKWIAINDNGVTRYIPAW